MNTPKRPTRKRRECDICGWQVPLNLEGCQRTGLHWTARPGTALTAGAVLAA